MAAESNTGGFHRGGETLGSALNFSPQAISSFQPINRNSSSSPSSNMMIPVERGGYFGLNANAASSTTTTTSSSSSSAIMMMMMPWPGPGPGNASIINSSPGGMVQIQPSNSSAASSLVIDSIPALKHDTGLAVEWSVDEQLKLEEGLLKYADEPSIMRYIKIAATLRDKTVRDVALRCRWMTRKRRKQEEYNLGKKVNNRKDKMVESSSMINLRSALSQNMVGYTLMTQNEPLLFEGISGTAKHLLEQNAQAFSQITTNISMLKLQDNIDLFCCARNNITAILNDMRDMPGIMSQMPPLPVRINDDLANSILPHTAQSVMFGSPSGIKLKQEPRC